MFTIPWNAVHVAVESVFTIPWKPCSRSRGIRKRSHERPLWTACDPPAMAASCHAVDLATRLLAQFGSSIVGRLEPSRVSFSRVLSAHRVQLMIAVEPDNVKDVANEQSAYAAAPT